MSKTGLEFGRDFDILTLGGISVALPSAAVFSRMEV